MSVDRAPTDQLFELRVVQDRETGIQEHAAGQFRLRYLSARSLESQRADAPGQDYFVVRQAGARLVFALCDGVSESFYGDLAARFLGDALVEWLWDALASGAFAQGAKPQALHDYLTSLTLAATEQVRALSLPDEAPPALHDVLEQKRASGSETVFVCGALELPGPLTAEGHAVFAWMGNAELQFLGPGGDRNQELGAQWNDRQRWSTRTGPKGGLPNTFAGTLRDIRHVLAYSDGLAPLREALGRGLSDESLAAEVDRLGQTPTSDDIALLEIEVLDAPASAAFTTATSLQGTPAAIPSAAKPMGARSRRVDRYLGARAWG